MITKNSSIFIALSIILLIAGGACKNQQKIAEQQAAEARLEKANQAKALLMQIVNDDGSMTLEEKESILEEAKAIGSDDPEVLRLIAEVEDDLQRERDDLARTQAQTDTKMKASPTLEEEVWGLFGNIASASSNERANQYISQGLEKFSSPDALVLIIINQSGDIKDYDEPTTITKYLNYLKDQKSNPNRIFDLVLDDNGKIKEVELIKQ